MYAQVIVDIAAEQVDRLFTYRIPEHVSVSCGYRVLVPFGSRTKEGYVVQVTSECTYAPEKVKDVIAPLEDYPALLPSLMELAQEISAKMRCPLSEALRLMLPAQMRGARIKVKTEPAAKLLSDTAELEQYANALSKKQVKKRTLLRILADGKPHLVADLKAMVRTPLPALKELEKAHIISLSEIEVLRSPYAASRPQVREPALTLAQRETLDELRNALQLAERLTTDERRNNPALERRLCFLLFGVTGSGKTEIYIRLVRECLRSGRGAIVLVPEIALTPQMVDWFRSRFGEQAAVLHSRLSAGERFDEWRRIRRGDARLVIGARSAVFAPVEKLGAIIIDEEHEQSYQSESFPQYDAREIAKSRVTREGGMLLLASATPSIYSFAMARRGDYTLLEMPERVNQHPLPQIFVVDMRKELQNGNRGIFSSLLHEKLRTCLANGQQAMLFINRRGYSPSVTCRMCGTTVKCSQCDVAMAYHRSDNNLHCHYCGAQRPLPLQCPVCGSTSIRTVGVGTQKVEEELLKSFPGTKVIRMDLDTTRTKNAHYELLNAFRARQAQVLIGTQMIAKGLDFPQVTLVGAVLADLSLNLPDYRSAERTFQLLVQVAGRAGRADIPGEVVIQSYKPEHYAIRAAAAQDYRAYFEEEFSRRRASLYPPFTTIVRFLCEGDDADSAMQGAQMLSKNVRQYFEEHPAFKRRLLFMRTDEAPIAFIQGRYRAQVLMKLLRHPDSENILSAFQSMTGLPLPNGVRACLEINPGSLA